MDFSPHETKRIPPFNKLEFPSAEDAYVKFG